MDWVLVYHVNVIYVAEVRRMCRVGSKPMKLRTINVECLANRHTNTHHFNLLNNDFTGFVYKLRGHLEVRIWKQYFE